jgi:hypothetical protein
MSLYLVSLLCWNNAGGILGALANPALRFDLFVATIVTTAWEILTTSAAASGACDRAARIG